MGLETTINGAVQLAVVGAVWSGTVAKLPLEQVAGFGLELMALSSGIRTSAASIHANVLRRYLAGQCCQHRYLNSVAPKSSPPKRSNS